MVNMNRIFNGLKGNLYRRSLFFMFSIGASDFSSPNAGDSPEAEEQVEE